MDSPGSISSVSSNDLTLEEIEFRLGFNPGSFQKSDPIIKKLFLYIRYSKIEELENILQDEQLNQLFPYPIGCIPHGFDGSWTSGYYFGEEEITHGHSFGDFTFEFIYIEKEDNEFPFGSEIKWSVLHLASALGKQDVVNFLLLKGADHKLKDATGRNSEDISKFRKTNIDFKYHYYYTILKYYRKFKFPKDISFKFQ